MTEDCDPTTVVHFSNHEWVTAAIAIAADIIGQDTGAWSSPSLLRIISDHIGPPAEPRAMGAVMRTLARRGVIYNTGQMVPAGSHARPVPLWRRRPDV